MASAGSEGRTFGTVDEVVVVVHVSCLGALLDHILVGVVVEIVGAEVHIAVKQGPGTVDTGHIGGGYAIAAAPAALAAAHTAFAADIAHHRAGQVIETTVVGIVAVQYEAQLPLLCEIAHERRALVTPVGIYRRAGGDVTAAAGHDVSEGALHHSGLDVEVYHLLFLPVVYAGKLRLLALLVNDLELVDEFGGDVLGGQLRVVEEESLAIDGYLGDGLAVYGDGAVLADFHAGELLEEVFEHIVLGCLEGIGVVLQGILLDDDGIADGRNRSGIQHLLVGIHTYLAEVEVTIYADMLLESLVPEQFRLEKVGTFVYLGNHDLSGFGAEVVCIGLFGPVAGKGYGGERNGFAVGRIH